ncbi:MAG: response regulator [Bryobacteraceae bacterium]|jgi:DNA-binding NtrC family response regulator
MGKGPGRILIVDDEPALLKMMSVYLGRLGYEVETAGGTEGAWARIEADPEGFAVAVLDATMPGLSLNELALRALRAAPGLRVIAASGYPVDMSEIQAAGQGRVAFLPKPFTPEMLADAVRRMLGPEEETV